MGFRRRIEDSPRVDLTAMIDVVFLLLIFFMISTTFIEHPGLKIDLPTAAATDNLKANREIRVYLTKDGALYLNRQELSRQELVTRLTTPAPAERDGMTFLLMADQEARHGQVVELMDVAQQAGFSSLAIAIDRAAHTAGETSGPQD